jgi:hypothetical protein
MSNNENGFTLVSQVSRAKKVLEAAEAEAKASREEFKECLQLPNTEENRIIKALAYCIVGDKIDQLANAQATYRKAEEALRIFKHKIAPALSDKGKALRH